METNRVVTGDALDVMTNLPGGAFRVVLTDPPYCSGARGESDKLRGDQSFRREVPDEQWFNGDSMTVDTYEWFLRSCALEWNRLLEVGGSVLIFTDWRMQNYVRRSIESVGFTSRNLIVWDKGSFGMGHGFRHQHELILQFTKGDFTAEEHDRGNVLTHSRPTDDEHPTQKPVSLLMDLLRVVASEGDRVLDPFTGSGSTGVAAMMQDMEFVGIERDPEYANTARERIVDAESQQGLEAFTDGGVE